MSRFTVIFVCLALAHVAYSLNCYQCTVGKCDSVEGLTPVKCGGATAAFKPACEKVVHKNKADKQTNTTRRCVLVKDQNDKSQCPTVPYGFEEVECSLCFDDNCNTAPATYLNFFTVFGMTAAFFLTKFVLH